jgi:hypothetical protein
MDITNWNMKKIFILAYALALGSCAKIYHGVDNRNPCTYSNSAECQKWKKAFPKEYERYKERMKKNGDVKSSVSENPAPNGILSQDK